MGANIRTARASRFRADVPLTTNFYSVFLSTSAHVLGPAMPPTTSRPDVLYAFLGDVRESSRALRQLRALREMDASLSVLMVGEQPRGDVLAEGLSLSPNLEVTCLETPPGSGPRFFWALHGMFRKAALATPGSIYLASDLYTLPALAAAASHHGGKLVYDSRELYAHLDSSAGRPWVRGVWKAVEQRFISRVDAVFTVNDSIAKRLAATYKIERPTVLHNVPAFVDIAPSNKLREALRIPDGRKIVLYQGGLREGRGLPQLIRAVAAVDMAHLVIIGDGPYEQEARRLASVVGERASFLPFIPPDSLLSWTASADLGAVLIEPLTESLRLALPNKLFEYLMAGIPVLASPLPEMKAVLDRFAVGLLVDPNDHSALVTALRKALSNETERAEWRANAALTLKAYSWEADKRLFQQTLQNLLTA